MASAVAAVCAERLLVPLIVNPYPRTEGYKYIQKTAFGKVTFLTTTKVENSEQQVQKKVAVRT